MKKYDKKADITKGYILFLIFIYRYIYYGSSQLFDEGRHICLHQKRIGEFLSKDDTTICGYIKKAVTEDHFLAIEGKGIFSQRQRHESNIYSFDLVAINNYLLSKGINPILDKNEAKSQIEAFITSLHCRHKRMSPEEREKAEKRKLARKKRRANKLKKSYVHSFYNQIIQEYNRRIEALGFGDYKDSFLDELDFRASNNFCYTRNPSKHIDRPERVAELKRVGIIPEDEYYECEFKVDDKNKPETLHSAKELEDVYEKDTNGSIYRLTYNLNHEVQLSQDIDIYQLFWEKAGFEQPYSKDVKNKGLKMACMPIYMKEQALVGSVKEFNEEKSIRNLNSKRRLICTDGYDDSSKDERFKAYEFLTSYTGMNLYTVLCSLRQAMHEVLGVQKFYGRDIFLYESELHADIKLQLLDRGIFVLNAFDGFFGKPDEFTEELFFEVYYDATERLKDVLNTDKLLKQETV